ncbi:hypothetical protein Tco_1146270, partial [Tanacetum coccineum]
MQLLRKLQDDQKCMKKVEHSSRSKAIEDIISIGSFVEALVLNHYVLVRKILLKFISKGEPTQVYGISISDVMLNDDIKNSKAYQTYLALSTGTKPPKKGRGKSKGLMSQKAVTPAPEKKKSVPKKKGSINVEENILSDPYKAIQEQASEVDKEAVKRKKKKKMKGIATDVVIQELLNLKNGTRKSRKDYILQQITKDSSKGSGSKPEVPDDPNCKSIGSREGDEEIILSSDDERTESEREVAESDKADDETSDEEEMHTNIEKHTDDETIDDEEEVHEDEEMHDVDEVHADDKETDEENTDAEKVDTKKTEEEKKEKPEFPSSSSSLSLSSDYGNQFLNVSSDVSL